MNEKRTLTRLEKRSENCPLQPLTKRRWTTGFAQGIVGDFLASFEEVTSPECPLLPTETCIPKSVVNGSSIDVDFREKGFCATYYSQPILTGIRLDNTALILEGVVQTSWRATRYEARNTSSVPAAHAAHAAHFLLGGGCGG